MAYRNDPRNNNRTNGGWQAWRDEEEDNKGKQFKKRKPRFEFKPTPKPSLLVQEHFEMLQKIAAEEYKKNQSGRR